MPMLSWIVLIILLALLVALGTWIWGRFLGRGEVMDAGETPKAVMEDNRRAVAADDLDSVRFDVVSHGYRQDQVDDVIAVLQARIAELQGHQERVTVTSAAPAADPETASDAE